MAEENKNFRLRIITPERRFLEQDVTMVEFNTTEGEIGIYKEHIPLTVIVKPGVLKVTAPEGNKKAALHGGFAEILQDSVTILAETIEWSDEIDKERAVAAKERAEERLREKAEDTDLMRAEAALMRALTRIQALQ